MLSGSALVLLELSEASSPESSTFSPSLETMVNLVPEAKATSTTIALRSAYRVMWKLHMSNMHGAKKITKLYRHNARCFEGSIMLEIMPA